MMKKKTAVFLLAAITMGASGAGAFAEADAGNASGSTAEETAGEVPAELSDDIYSFQIRLDGEIYSFRLAGDLEDMISECNALLGKEVRL